MKFVPYFLSAFAMILSMLMLYDGHYWGGDFAQYIAQAIALADDNLASWSANQAYIVDNSPLKFIISPYIYPWGTSLLLAPIYKIFGFNLIAFKMLSVLCYGIFIVMFYRFCKRFLEVRFCVIATLLFALNPLFLRFCNNIGSDILFLLFSFISVIFLARLFENMQSKVNLAQNGGGQNDCDSLKFTQLRFALFGGIFALFAYITRTNGLVIIFALFVMQIVLICGLDRRFARFLGANANLKVANLNLCKILAHILPYIIFICGALTVNYALGAGGSGHLSVLSQISLKNIAINVGYYICALSDFFALPNPFFALYSDFAYAYAIPNPLNFALFLATILLIYRGLRISFSKNPIATAFITLFMLGFMALLILWPPRQGIRFTFAIIPFLVFFGVLGLSKAKNLTQFVAIALIVAFIIKDIAIISDNIANDFKSPNTAGEAYSNEAKDIYHFIANHTPKDAKIIFFKPRVLYLNTNRLAFHATTLEHFKKADFALDVRWEWIETQMIHNLIVKLKAQDALNVVYKNKFFVLYKINPTP